VPPEALSLLTWRDLASRAGGVSDWTVAELRALTDADASSSTDRAVFAAFWEALETMTREERAGVLAFATGRSRLPAPGADGAGGLARSGSGAHVLRLDVKHGSADGGLPTASTCSWALHLPALTESERMARALRVAVQFSGTIDGDGRASGGASLLQLLDAGAYGLALEQAASPAGGAWVLQPLWPDAPDSVAQEEEAEAQAGTSSPDDEADGDGSDDERLESWQVARLLDDFRVWRGMSAFGEVSNGEWARLTEASAEVRDREGLFRMIEAQGDEMLSSWEMYSEEAAEALEREEAMSEGEEDLDPENCRQQ
jgi:hypothetical protein